MRNPISHWPVVRQLREGDLYGRGIAAKSGTSASLAPRTVTADKVVKSVCPYCGVGCAQNVYVKDDKIVHVEGDPDSPVSRGRLCPKGANTLELSTSPARRYHVLHRRPHGTDWERMPLDEALDMVAERVIATRREHWDAEFKGKTVNRTMGIASLGGATLDNGGGTEVLAAVLGRLRPAGVVVA
ncbi:hypothetical protein GHK86_17025, partial [Acidimicrobiaceae bacterium USS-CC1]|nr:hypothetical protein [Acidiferrimicrobium australe]